MVLGKSGAIELSRILAIFGVLSTTCDSRATFRRLRILGAFEKQQSEARGTRVHTSKITWLTHRRHNHPTPNNQNETLYGFTHSPRDFAEDLHNKLPHPKNDTFYINEGDNTALAHGPTPQETRENAHGLFT